MIRFLDPTMLLFCAAAAVPPLIAWLGRRHAASREWAAMEILARAAGRTKVRRRYFDWLVVAMRCAMLLAVACAAARPLFVPAPVSSGAAADEAVRRERRAIVVGEAAAVVAAIESVAADFAPVRSITETLLDDEPFESASLVVLADGVTPSAATARRLGRFVERGGGVAVILGPRNTSMPAIDLPAGQTIRLTATAEGEPETDLAGPTVRRMARIAAGQAIPGVTPGVGASTRGPPVVLARAMPSGEPLAVRIGVGRGMVGAIALPLAIEGWSHGGWAAGTRPPGMGPAAWSDLPAWPAFLPFVERTILSLASAGDGAAVNREVGIAGWLAGLNLSGALLVAALVLVLVDPIASRLAVASIRHRGPVSRIQLAALAARIVAIAILIVMLSGWSRPPAGMPDAAAEPARPSLSVRTPRIARLGDAVGIDIDAVLAGRDSSERGLTADLVDANGSTVASTVLVEKEPLPRDGRPRIPRRGSRFRGRIVWRPHAAGGFSGTVRIRGGEFPAAASVSLRVADEPLRVLLLDRPRFESRFLSRLLSRDRRFAVTERLQGSGPMRPTRTGDTAQDVPQGDAAELPATREDWSRFDVVVIGGVDPLVIPEPVAAALVEAASRDGVGIVWSLDAASDPEAIAVSPLARLLPFRGVSRHPPFTTGCGIELATAGEEAAWLAVADDAAASREAWRTMPSVHAAMQPTVIRPTARVMATCTSGAAAAAAVGPKSPFILVDQAGESRVVAFLAETWRLRQWARGPLVDRLLSQAMLHAAEPHFASRLGVDKPPGPTTKPDDETIAAESSRGVIPTSDEPNGLPSTARPVWNHPAMLIALVAACGIGWWIRERAGEGP